MSHQIPYGILPDWAIKQYVKIEPFEKGEARPGTISYGTSSYGYDVRLGSKFKLFSAVHAEGLVVDPKRMSNKAFVDVDGDHCIIPPNHYALAESYEYLEIPRDVTVICIGKCLSGDTRILNPVTGAWSSLKERGQASSVVSVSNGRFTKEIAGGLIYSGVQKTFKVRTWSGLEIRATSQHPLFVKDYGWKRVNDIRAGDKILRANYLPFFGKERMNKKEIQLLGLMIADGQCLANGSSPVYTKQDPHLVSLFKEAVTDVLSCQVTKAREHHYRIVNKVGRGGAATKSKANLWLEKYNINKLSRYKEVPAKIFEQTRDGVAEFLRVLFSGDGTIYLSGKKRKTPQAKLEYCSASPLLIEGVRHLLTRFGISSIVRKSIVKGIEYPYICVYRKGEIARFFSEIGFVPGCKKDVFYKENVKHALPIPEDPKEQVFDEIVSIDESKEEPVYDIEVPTSHNFVANDLVVHNSTYARAGIIANVTPLEAAWKGRITIEISNATPLPVKLYAMEGICQLLFFRAEQQCDVSYADKKGIYQGQPGLTLPKVRE